MKIEERPFGKTRQGESASIYTLRNTNGVEAAITNYGGIVVSLCVPDGRGEFDDIVLGYDTLDEYIENNPYFGSIIGRYGNRIAMGRFVLDGKEYVLATNNDSNHLHGGLKGFDKVVWDARPVEGAEGPTLELTYLSPDGEEGYPGNLSVRAIYVLTNDNGLRLEFTATTDKPTIVNLTHHSYFNLSGDARQSILDHEVMIVADRFTPVDENLIPTGELRPVAGTALDFTTPTPIGGRINADDQQLKYGGGYDHNWVLNKQAGTFALVARVCEQTSGRIMGVYTTEPGMQFYSGNFLDGTIVGKGGIVYKHRCAFCMEPQHFPDSPNKPHFPPTVLRPGEQYRSVIEYRFSVC